MKTYIETSGGFTAELSIPDRGEARLIVTEQGFDKPIADIGGTTNLHIVRRMLTLFLPIDPRDPQKS